MGLAWVGDLGWQNRSAVRELADELRDEGDEGASRRAREKFLRWELESDEREDGEMKNKRMKKNKQPSIILIGSVE